MSHLDEPAEKDMGEPDRRDDLAAARGIGTAVILSAALLTSVAAGYGLAAWWFS